MNLGQLRFTVAAATERSFSRAAERCHVAQPTLSSGIALLEEEFGGQLFVRTTRKVELSPFGEQVLPLIEAVLRAQTELEAGVRTFYDPSQKIVRIGLSPLVDTRRLARVLEPYKIEYPAVQTFFKECFLEDLDQRLRSVQVDMVIRPRYAEESAQRSVRHVPFYEEDLFYLQRQTGSTTARDAGSIELRDVVGETFVLGPEGCGLAPATRDLFKKIGATTKEYSGQALSYQVMQEWADIGIGATILPGSKIAEQFRGKARRLMLAPTKPARLKFEVFWIKNTAYPKHVGNLHRHFERVVPALVKGEQD